MAKSRPTRRQNPMHGPARMRAVAYYRSTADHKSSINGQRQAVRRWAKQHGVKIIREFTDHGQRARCHKLRPAFHRLIHDWVKRRDHFDYVLCHDVSRWGRCHEMNQLAHYGGLCQRHGKQLIFTASPPAPDDSHYAQYRRFERCQAALYSRYLSNLVFHFKRNR
jgi:DNA invertase Pin-like site-specific DNA recombinase